MGSWGIIIAGQQPEMPQVISSGHTRHAAIQTIGHSNVKYIIMHSSRMLMQDNVAYIEVTTFLLDNIIPIALTTSSLSLNS